MDELNADWGHLRRSAEGTGEAYEQALAEADGFQGRMAAYGAPWGFNNAVSQAIGLCYQAARDLLAACHAENLDAYRGYPEGMRTMAGNGLAAEQESAIGAVL
jgi:hypothetical protein